jgi:uncharacterized phiE125 gp8 family phage protein
MTSVNRRLSRVVAPASEPVTLEEAKRYLRVDAEDDDALIEDIIVAARMHAESWLRRSLITQSWLLGFEHYKLDMAALPMGPVQSVTSVVILGNDGSSHTMSTEAYYLSENKEALHFWGGLIGFRLEITYVAGYGDVEDVPRPIKLGMLSHLAALYDGRGETQAGGLPEQSVNLYAPFRGVGL